MNKVNGLLLSLCFWLAPVLADETPPEMELLEFLGEWSQADQAWLELQQQQQQAGDEATQQDEENEDE